MSDFAEIHHPGRALVRFLIARGAAAASARRGSPIPLRQQIETAASRWGHSSRALDVIKSAVAGGGTGSGEWGAELSDLTEAAAEFLDAIRPRTVLGKLQGVRRVPANTPVVTTDAGSTAFWAGAGKATPLSRSAFDRVLLKPLNIIAMQVFSKDLFESADPAAEALIHRDLASAVVELSDTAFLDAANAGVVGERPPAIVYGAPAFTATGDLADDLEAAIGMLDGAIDSAAWVMHPRLAASIGLRAGARGVAADLGARGGSLAGLPVLTSAAAQFDSDNGSIILVDAAGVVLTDGGGEFSTTADASVEMTDSPSGDATGPTAATSPVSLFQTDSVGIKVVRRINWMRARAAGAVVINGATYPAT